MALLLVLPGCTGRAAETSAPCGIAAVVAPTTVLEAFTVANQPLSEPPRRLPERTVARLAAGPAYRALLGRSDSGLVVGVEGTVPESVIPAFGVLVVQKGTGAVQGVLLYEGLVIEGAPRLGIVSVGSRTLPLIGVELDMAGVQDARCPIFPDSLRQ
jgi:hypothetical protein